jgi:glycosyltransferase involved in cell wall biosynthesis
VLENTRSDVELITNASDAEIVDYFRQARATIYTSPAEGYGLPPMESLFAGIPVVVHRDLPALDGKSLKGQIRLEHSTPENIRKAIEQISDNQTALELWRDASEFPSVTWQSVVSNIADWVTRKQ